MSLPARAEVGHCQCEGCQCPRLAVAINTETADRPKPLDAERRQTWRVTTCTTEASVRPKRVRVKRRVLALKYRLLTDPVERHLSLVAAVDCCDVDREIEKFIIRQPPMGEKDDYDSEHSWISDGLPSNSRRRRRGGGRWEVGE